VCRALLVWPQCYSLRAKTYKPADGPWVTETCRVIMEGGHEIGVAEPGTARRNSLKTAYIYQAIKF
jgi:hypothetical protein